MFSREVANRSNPGLAPKLAPMSNTDELFVQATDRPSKIIVGGFSVPTVISSEELLLSFDELVWENSLTFEFREVRQVEVFVRSSESVSSGIIRTQRVDEVT